MKLPAVAYDDNVYTSPMGHEDALWMLIADHGPPCCNALTLSEWAYGEINEGRIRYGWKVNGVFQERGK